MVLLLQSKKRVTNKRNAATGSGCTGSMKPLNRHLQPTRPSVRDGHEHIVIRSPDTAIDNGREVGVSATVLWS